MKEKLEHEKLQIITINSNELTWIKEGKEAIVKGELFDVKEFAISNNSIILTGLFDKQEKELNRQIANANSKQQNENATLQIGFMLLFSFYENHATETDLQQTILVTKPFGRYFQSIPSVYLSKATPPPNFC